MIHLFETTTHLDRSSHAFARYFKTNQIDYKLHRRTGVVQQMDDTEWKTFDKIKPDDLYFFQGILRGTGKLIRTCQEKNAGFFYGDNPYIKTKRFTRHWSWRITKNNFDINHIDSNIRLDMGRRLDLFEINKSVKKWKKDGSHILVCPPSKYQQNYHLGDKSWYAQVIQDLKKYTRRPIIVRDKKGPQGDQSTLQADLRDAHAVVTFNSAISVEAAMEGVPSFCDPKSFAASLGNTDLKNIDTPIYSTERENWFATLLQNQFTAPELETGYAWEIINK
jgi:hypothetical protein